MEPVVDLPHLLMDHQGEEATAKGTATVEKSHPLPRTTVKGGRGVGLHLPNPDVAPLRQPAECRFGQPLGQQPQHL